MRSKAGKIYGSWFLRNCSYHLELPRHLRRFNLQVKTCKPALSAAADFRHQFARERAGLAGVFVVGLVPVGDRNRRGELLEGERADAHSGVERDGHAAEV